VWCLLEMRRLLLALGFTEKTHHRVLLKDNGLEKNLRHSIWKEPTVSICVWPMNPFFVEPITRHLVFVKENGLAVVTALHNVLWRTLSVKAIL
jgi:hypothetical protein